MRFPIIPKKCSSCDQVLLLRTKEFIKHRIECRAKRPVKEFTQEMKDNPFLYDQGLKQYFTEEELQRLGQERARELEARRLGKPVAVAN